MTNIVSLSSLIEKERCVISKIEQIEVAKHKRLIELGFVKDEKLEVLKKNKNLMIVGLRGYSLCLDCSLAASIKVIKGAK